MILTKTVFTKWQSTTINHYKSLGYEFTKFEDRLEVLVSHLPNKSNIRLNIKCDVCGAVYHKPYYQYISDQNKRSKDMCGDCKSNKKLSPDINSPPVENNYISKVNLPPLWDDVSTITLSNSISNEILPNGGIYKFYSFDGELMYIGKAGNLRHRLLQHISGNANTQDVKHNFYSVSCSYLDNPVDRDIYETYLINILRPPLNVEKVYTYQTQRENPKYKTAQQIKAEHLHREKIFQYLKNNPLNL